MMLRRGGGWLHRWLTVSGAFLFIYVPACKQKDAVPVGETEQQKLMAFYGAADSQRIAAIMTLAPRIDSLFRHFATEEHIPGLAWGLVSGGRLIHQGQFGYANIKERNPAHTATCFRIASMSKSVTAMAILKLRDEGKLSLDDPASRYIPLLAEQRLTRSITIRHLLTHSAGFPEDNPWGDRQLQDSDAELQDLIRRGLSFSNQPGVAYEYSNLGFALLGKIITIVSGQPYQSYVRDQIWRPLQMKDSYWEYGEIPPKQLAHGYRWLNQTWVEEPLLHDSPDGSWGAMGAMISTVADFAEYMNLHLEAWREDTTLKNILHPASLREMHQPGRMINMNSRYSFETTGNCPVVNAYGYGLRWMKDCKDRVFVSHSGGLPGFGSQWCIMPDYDLGIVALANRTYAPMGRINMNILDRVVSEAGISPRAIPASPVLETRKNELMQFLPDWKDASQAPIFAENFFDDYPIDSLRALSRSQFQRIGPVLSQSAMRPLNQLRGSFTVRGQKGAIDIFFTLSPENPPRIQAMEISEVK